MYSDTYEIRFSINGKDHVVPRFATSKSLNDYLREHAGLKGTKVMCREAGCGCCSVAVTKMSPETNKLETHSIQSCITPLYSVDGWQVTTVEGLGSQKNGFHPIQDRIAKFNGSQCGYCTPGMVMNMYGLLHQNPQITAQEVEDNFDGNLCRCTGYRPILDAMKSFTTGLNSPDSKPIDIEDLNKHLCPKTGAVCEGEHAGQGGTRCLNVEMDGVRWYRPSSLEDLSKILGNYKEKNVKLLLGNTASGIFKNEGPFDVIIDLHQVKELFSYKVNSDDVKFGSALSLTSFLNKLKANQDTPGFHYFAAIVRHIKVVANVMVRNAGSIAGNLMIKHNHPEFPSDIFTLLEAAGAKVEIHDSLTSQSSQYSLIDFLHIDMKGKVMMSVILPKLADNVLFKSYKITPRWQNAHAYVNAAFKIETENRVIKGKPSLVFGGINADTTHAIKTEQYLENKTLSDESLKEALKILKNEIHPEQDVLLASPQYRRDLATSLLYKVLLQLYRSDSAKLRSGPDHLHRPISTGLQTYQEMKSEFPLKQPLPKKTSPLQASGEAQYVNDIPTFQQELFGAFVITDQAAATLESMDATEALKMSGVVAFLSSKDIPENGVNRYLTSIIGSFPFQPQELFASKEILFAGQAVGLIVAETQSQANAAAKQVKIKYCDIKKPILSIEESIVAGREHAFPNKEQTVGNPEEAWKSVDHVVEGECRMGSQYHFFMETHVSLAVPSEDGLDVYASTQIGNLNQIVAADVIGVPLSYINMVVPRVGGGFGGKAWDSCPMTAAATLAAYTLGKPVRVSLDLSTNMRLCGKRAPLLAKYKAGYSAAGEVQVIDMDFYADVGCSVNNCGELNHIMKYIDQGYYVPNWSIRKHPMFTNKQTMSPCRAPGSVPAALVIETIMEHISKKLNKHPILVKELNLYKQHQSDPMGHEMTDCTIREVWRRLKDTAEVEARMRQVDSFNKENLWKKRGITMTTSKYGMAYFASGFTCNISIFAQDGSVVVSQGGVEMGQGLYTKVAQGVAYTLGIPLDRVKVRPNFSIIAPNAACSGGSTTSESALQAAIGASNILKERLDPMREKFPDADWKELCGKAYANKIDLSAKYTNSLSLGKPFFNYFTYCAAVIETEVDVLTGESQIRRVDIMCDFGESLNPTIDIGQIEGAFVMGLGCFLSEDIKFDSSTGKILNDGTWEYKPPTTKDIPIDWRIHLLPDRPNPAGIMSSKATGEPPICLAVGALLANKLAIQSARSDLHGADDYIETSAPFTVEKAQQSANLSVENFTLQ